MGAERYDEWMLQWREDTLEEAGPGVNVEEDKSAANNHEQSETVCQEKDSIPDVPDEEVETKEFTIDDLGISKILVSQFRKLILVEL